MYDREATRAKLRDMLRSMGIDVPDELPDREIVVEDENGKVISRRRMGQATQQEQKDERID